MIGCCITSSFDITIKNEPFPSISTTVVEFNGQSVLQVYVGMTVLGTSMLAQCHNKSSWQLHQVTYEAASSLVLAQICTTNIFNFDNIIIN